MKIVILDGYTANPGDLSWAGLEQLGETVVYDRTLPSEVVARAADADVVVTNKVAIDRPLMERLPRLRLISVLATGYNIIDVAAARERGITVCNVPAYSTESVAQMVLAHLLAHTNRVEHYARENRAGRWSRSADFSYTDGPVRELASMSIGIVGLGHIGMRVAEIAHVLGMEVFALTGKAAGQLPAYVRKSTLEGLLHTCDVVTLHCPLMPETRGMICRDTLALMRPGSLLINTGRGPLVVERDVAAALRDGTLGGYAADVMAQEPPAADNPLLREPRATITPHIAWASVEARRRLLAATAGNVRAWMEGKAVNRVE